jgi:hypothetical protein
MFIQSPHPGQKPPPHSFGGKVRGAGPACCLAQRRGLAVLSDSDCGIVCSNQNMVGKAVETYRLGHMPG